VFLGKFECNVDKKLRVSVPPQFRALLAKEEYSGFVAYEALRPDVEAIEACGMSYMRRLNDLVAELDEFSEERELAETIFSSANTLPMDGAGRVSLPPDLLEFAGITEKVTFVGVGETFQLWEPERFRAYEQAKRQRVRTRRISLRPRLGAAQPVGGQ